MKFHGYYCGPNWSDNKQQVSVLFGRPAADELDQLCKVHDNLYARAKTQQQKLAADQDFASQAIKLGWPKSIVAGIAVGGQGLARAIDILVSQMAKKQSKALIAYNNFKNKAEELEKVTRKSSTPKMKTVPPPTTRKPVPAATVTTSYNGPPSTSISRNGGVVLKHRGLVAGFTGSTTFTAKRFQVNPGLGSVFPWCSQLARSYDKYIFRKLKFEFRSVVPTTTAGVVMMSFDYDTLDALPASKFEHAQTSPNVESNSFNSFELRVQCDNVPRFIRQGALTEVDLKTYDLGQFVISSAYGVASLLGEIYVDYEVELIKPSHGVPCTTKIAGTGGSATPFSPAVLSGTAQCVSLSNDANRYLVVERPGEYIWAVSVMGSSLTSMTIPTFVGSTAGGSALNTLLAPTIDSGGTRIKWFGSMRVGAGDVISFNSKVTGTTTAMDVWITEGEYATLV